jgi:hypothetical protein
MGLIMDVNFGLSSEKNKEIGVLTVRLEYVDIVDRK